MKDCDVLKLSRYTRNNMSGLNMHILAVPGIGFKLSSEDEQPNDNALSVAKYLRRKKI